MKAKRRVLSKTISIRSTYNQTGQLAEVNHRFDHRMFGLELRHFENFLLFSPPVDKKKEKEKRKLNYQTFAISRLVKFCIEATPSWGLNERLGNV